jgi:hypothetical protein
MTSLVTSFEKLQKSPAEWRQLLPPNAYEVLFEEDTDTRYVAQGGDWGSPVSNDRRESACCNAAHDEAPLSVWGCGVGSRRSTDLHAANVRCRVAPWCDSKGVPSCMRGTRFVRSGHRVC